MKNEHYHYERTEDDFETIAEYLDALTRGSEVAFEYNGREYGVFYLKDGFYVSTLGVSEHLIVFTRALFRADYPIEDVTIRDIITSVEVTLRNV